MFNFKSALVVLLFAGWVFSQTTSWQTTRDGNSSGGCRLVDNKLNVTIHPFHLDVEEEAVIMAEGSVWWGDAASLEIVGDFYTTPGTAIRSMLLWNGSQILKAKLKDKNAADSAYEAVVDRERMVAPRDPALIEQIGDNHYRFKIFPVSINQSRRIRILYSIPLQAFSNGLSFEFNTVFTVGPNSRPDYVPLTVNKAETPIRQYLLSYGSVKKEAQFGVTYQIPASSLVYNRFYNWNNNLATAIRITPDSTGRNRAYACRVPEGVTAGNYMAVFSKIPDTIKAFIDRTQYGNYTLEATVTAGSKSFIADLSGGAQYVGVYLKSSTAWDKAIHWTVYGDSGWAVFRYAQVMQPETSSAMTALLPLFWGAKYSLDEGNGNLGALYGFVDAKMSLLALESDSLPRSVAALYEESGVPPLAASEIIIRPSQLPHAPANEGIFEIDTPPEDPIYYAVEVVLADNTNQVKVLPNGFVMLTLKNKSLHKALVQVYDLRGRLVGSLTLANIQNGSVRFHLPSHLKGRLILRIKAGNETLVQKIVLM